MAHQNPPKTTALYAQSTTAGLQMWNNLLAVLAHPPTLDKVMMNAAGLTIEHKVSSLVPNPYHQSASGQEYTVKNSSSPTTRSYFSNLIAANGLLISAVWNEKFDNEPPEPRIEPSWSDVVYLCYKRSFPAVGSLATLRSIMTVMAANDQTTDVITEAYTLNNLNVQGPNPVTWTPNAPAANMRNAFFAILSTPNVKGAAWMLKDHPHESHAKTINNIQTVQAGAAFAIMINLS